MKRTLLLFTLFFINTVQAQDLNLFQGDYEFTGSAQYNRAAFGGNIRMGTFTRDYLQVGGEAGYYDSDFYTGYSIGTYVIRHFETNTYWIPYVGSGLKFAALEPVFLEQESGVALEFFGGLKYFLADNVSVNTEIRLGYSSAKTYLADNEYTDSDYRFNIGLSYYW